MGIGYPLTMKHQLDILKDIEHLLPLSIIAAKYHVHPMTIRRIQSNAAIIAELAEKGILQKKRKRIKRPLYVELEHHLFRWIRERKALGDPISNSLLLKKALELKESMVSCSGFKASPGWLKYFKKRHNISLVNIHRETVCLDEDAAEVFVNDFQKLIEEEEISLENVYDMHVCTLLWKDVPIKILEKLKVKCTDGYHKRSNRITLGLCANALGTNKMMPLLIHSRQNPLGFKHWRNKLPIIFKSQPNVCMNQSIFIDWFNNDFKPNVQAYQLRQKTYGKVILLNSSNEHNVPIDMLQDSYFRIMHLSPHIASLIQPMNQGIIQEIKRLFRQKLVQNVLQYDTGIKDFFKNYTFIDCIDMVHESWTEITSEDIQNSWENMISVPVPSSEETQERDPLQCDLSDLISTITEEQSTEEHAKGFLSQCKKEERTSFSQMEEAQGKENNGNEDEDIKEEKIIIVPQESCESANELKYLFERLIFYTADAPHYIQLMVEAVKVFFLDNECDTNV